VTVNDPKQLYGGVRPSDLRFDNWHVLAEYIAQTQQLVTALSKTQERSEHLLHEATSTSQRGMDEFKALSKSIAAEGGKLGAALGAVVEREARALVHGIASAQAAGGSAIFQASEIVRARCQELVCQASKLSAAAARLEKATVHAVAEQEKLQDSFSKLQSYKVQMDRYEVAMISRIEEAKRKFYQGVSLSNRLLFVFFPPATSVVQPKRPNKPSTPAAPPARSLDR